MKYVKSNDIKINTKILRKSGLFDDNYYLSRYEDIKNSGWNPLDHYVKWGYKESFRQPNALFSNYFYINSYLSNEDLDWNPLTHYVLIGKDNGNKMNIFDSPIIDYSYEKINNILNALNSKISIVIPMFNYSEIMNDCFDHIIKNTNTFINLIILTDNKSFDKINSFCNDEKFNIHIKIKEESIGETNFIMNVIKKLNTDIVLLNPYSIVPSNWLTKIIVKAYSDENIGIVAPLSNSIINFSPLEVNDNSSLIFTVDGLNTIVNKSSLHNPIYSQYIDGFCSFIKKDIINKINIAEDYLIFDEKRNIFGIFYNDDSFDSIIEDSVYVYNNPIFFENEKPFFNSLNNGYIGEINTDNILEYNLINLINSNINDAISLTNLKTLSNRLLFVVNEEDIDFLNDYKYYYILKNYDCYFLTATNNKIKLFKERVLLKEWDIIGDGLRIRDNDFKNIYFNIISSLNIDIVQIDSFIHHSFDLFDIIKSFRIPLLIICDDYSYICPFKYLNDSCNECNDTFECCNINSKNLKDEVYKNSLELFDYSNTIFSNEIIKDMYNHTFNEIFKDNKIIFNIFNDLKFKLDNVKSKKSIKIFVPGNLSENENNLKLIRDLYNFDKEGIIEFHFLGNIPNILKDCGYNHGKFTIDKFKNIIDLITPDFVGVFNIFPEIVDVINKSEDEKIPILISDDESLKPFVEDIFGVSLLSFSSANVLFNLVLDNFKFENYYNQIKELFYNDAFSKGELVKFNQQYAELYKLYDSKQQLHNKGSIIESNNKKVTFTDFGDFLSNSYHSPLIKGPFVEEHKRCFAVMDNIAKYLINNVSNCDKKPLFSVIMPSYNRKNIITKAIQSVLNQTYENFELIIVDDGSSDGTRELLNSFLDSRIKLIFHDTNKGSSAARNTALNVANGEYIAYLDSDNEWDSKYLETMLGAFIELSDADALYCGQLLYTDDVPFAVRFGSFNKSLLHNSNYIDMNCFCHKKEVYNKIGGFDENLSRLVDWDLILRTSNFFKLYSVPVLLSKYYFKSEDRISDNAVNNISIRSFNKNYIRCIQQKNKLHIKNYFKLKYKVSIIIPSYESLNDLYDCINSILSLNLDNIKIIVVDNNSNNAVRYYLNGLSENNDIILIQNEINYGFTYAVNQGIEISDSDSDILLLNNDAILTEGAIENMQKTAYEFEDSGIIVPQQVLPGGTPTIKTHVPYASSFFDCDVNPSKHHNNIINMPIFHDGEILELSFAPFFCAYIKRDVLNNSVGLDAELGRHYRSDRIFSAYIRHVLNLKIYHVSNAIVFHKLQKSTKKLKDKKEDYNVMFLKNQWEDELAKELNFKKPNWDY